MNVPEVVPNAADLPVHPFAQKFPSLPDDELKELADDICANGLREPVVTWSGQIIDGRNRLAACKLADVPPEVRQFEGTEAEAIGYIVSANLHRRHLTPRERADLVVEAEELMTVLQAEAKQSQGRRASVSGDTKGGRL